jgi:hypothetical protein
MRLLCHKYRAHAALYVMASIAVALSIESPMVLQTVLLADHGMGSS